jgi:hypothetical protein
LDVERRIASDGHVNAARVAKLVEGQGLALRIVGRELFAIAPCPLKVFT